MPCHDGRTEPDYVRKETEKVFKERLDAATRVACWLGNNLRVPQNAPSFVTEWIKEHNEDDRRRDERSTTVPSKRQPRNRR